MIKADFELYAPIKGFDGLYEVSTWGNVRSLDRWITYKNGRKHFCKGKVLKLDYNNYGYLRVYLFKDGKRTNFLVHRLVAKAFVPNPDNLPLVNHKDEVKDNNYPYNLEWCTDEYNTNYGTRNERVAKSNTNGKLSKKVYQYDLKGNLVNIWPSTMDCGRNGYDSKTISACCLGKLKTHQNFIWSYKPIENFDINNYSYNYKNRKGFKKVYQYDKDYNLTKIWYSAAEAARNGFSSGHISACCLGFQKTHKGFIWSYTEL